MLWVECAGPALLRAIASIAEPDVKEIYHEFIGKSVVKTAEIELQAAEELAPGYFGKFNRFAIPIARFADMAVWYLFLAGITEEFLADWTTQVWKMSGCIPDPKTTIYEFTGPFFGYIVNEEWQTCGEWTQVLPYELAPVPPRLYVPPGASASLAGTINVEGWFYPLQPYQTRWYDSKNDEQLDLISINQSDQASKLNSIHIIQGIAPHPEGRIIEFQIRSTAPGPGTNLFTNGRVQAQINEL